MCRASGAGEDETAQVICLRMIAAVRVHRHVVAWRQQQAVCGAGGGSAGRRSEELLSELKPVRRISRRPCVTVQPPHLWCCFASPQKETVVGHVALGRQLGGGRRGGGGQGACGTATGECSEETGREGFLSSSAGRQHSDDGSSALPGKRGTGWLRMRRKNTQVVHTVGGQPWSHIGGRLGAEPRVSWLHFPWT